ncbi:MAG: nicotinamide riboside transporter PnuC [Acidimicrobiales bacterium]|nr:nicotinamide mononucleotide transporter [Hyphomonadaceae bacterium]RZV45076.1 MAG: nicotinamide riboside transporter PnuC [Acidimicrobiales bacterium]
MPILEIIANAVMVLAVYLAARNHWSTWAFGIVGCAIFAVVFYQSNLFANVTLQGFFIVTNAIGWILWRKRSDEQQELPIRSVKAVTIGFVLLPLALVAAYGYGTMLSKTTGAALPVIDSLMLTFSIIAQFLLMGRKLETWWFWIIVNIVGIPLFASQGLYLTSFVYGLFLINAVYGYVNWKKEMRS